jgi:hypothetical protein
MHMSCCCLQGFRSLLTDSQDASYLFNAVLDAVVDHTLPLVQVGGGGCIGGLVQLCSAEGANSVAPARC